MVSGNRLSLGRETASRQAHNLEIMGSTPVSAIMSYVEKINRKNKFAFRRSLHDGKSIPKQSIYLEIAKRELTPIEYKKVEKTFIHQSSL